MDSDIAISIIGICILILLSAYFSATETAFSTLNKIRLKNAVNNGDKKMTLVYKLYSDYDSLISTVLIGNNIVNIASASLATILFAKLIANPSVSATVSTAVMTIVVLMFGEISPKTIAKNAPEAFAKFSAPFILALSYVFWPFIKIFGFWQLFISKIFKSKDSSAITDDEIITYVEEAEKEGGLNEYEGNLIRSAIEFDDMVVSEILTPRVDVEAISKDSLLSDAIELFNKTGFSRIPVFTDSIDNIIGIINEKDCYKAYFEKEKTLDNLFSKDIIYTTSHMKISILLRRLQKNKTHMAIVVDEYGGTMGIVTMEDILEELVGDIWDEHDEVVENFIQKSENIYEVNGDSSLEEFFEFFDINTSEDYEAVTVSGFFVYLLGALAKNDDITTFEHLEMKVLSTDNHTVDKLEVKVGKK